MTLHSSQFSAESHRTRIKVVPLLPPAQHNMLSDLQSIEEKREEKEIVIQSLLYSFMYALKSSEARRQYPKRSKMLFDFLGLPGSLEEQAQKFLDKARQNTQWAQDSIIIFLEFHKKKDGIN